MRKRQTKYACVVDADERTRPSLLGAGHKPHQNHITAKDMNSIHSNASSIKDSRCNDGSGERMGKTVENSGTAAKVRKKKEVIQEKRNKGRKVHFVSLVDLCHLKNSELEPQFQRYKGRVVLRGDIVKDDSGSYAVFTEQGSSASKTTAAKVMDIKSRLPGCAGQAADAASGHTRSKWKMLHNY